MNILIKITKENTDFFRGYNFYFLTYASVKEHFHIWWNMSTSHLFSKKNTEVLKKTTTLGIFFQSFPKSLKNFYTTKWHLFSINFCPCSSVVFIREPMLSIVFLPFYRSERQQLTLTRSLVFFGDLLEAFNWFPQKFIIARLNTYGLNPLALNPIQNYLASGKQKSQGKFFIQLLG